MNLLVVSLSITTIFIATAVTSSDVTINHANIHVKCDSDLISILFKKCFQKHKNKSLDTRSMRGHVLVSTIRTSQAMWQETFSVAKVMQMMFRACACKKKSNRSRALLCTASISTRIAALTAVQSLTSTMHNSNLSEAP